MNRPIRPYTRRTISALVVSTETLGTPHETAATLGTLRGGTVSEAVGVFWSQVRETLGTLPETAATLGTL